MRGHGKGGIWSLSWNVESSVLVSAGVDGTVRVWDCVKRLSEETKTNLLTGKPATDVVGGAKTDAAAAKKGKKDAVATADLISCFPTKKSPVYKVQFTRMNLVLAGGAYMP